MLENWIAINKAGTETKVQTKVMAGSKPEKWRKKIQTVIKGHEKTGSSKKIVLDCPYTRLVRTEV